MRRLNNATLLAAALVASLPLAAGAYAQEATEVINDLIHSPLPLYTFDWEQFWPRNFSSGDEFGCTSRVAFGDWQFVPTTANEYEEGHWERFSNYGVFHCAAILRRADERADLQSASFKYGFFVKLGDAKFSSKEWELWALQSGTVPGSEYTLFAREAGRKGLVDSFRVLQQRCPAGRSLEAKGLDSWSTRYCSIDSRAELLSLARRMLQLPPRGTLARSPPQAE